MKNVLLYSVMILLVLSITISLKAADEAFQLNLSQTSKELADPTDVIEIKPENDAKLRWGDDRLIYSGEVNANSWAVQSGLDDDAIDVDYFAGDTLRAVVACPDSALRIFRSNDNGQTWSYINGIFFSNDNVTEPKIVHGTDSTYHVFVRYLRDQDQLYTRAYRTANDATISGTGQYLAGTDSVKNYSVCTNRRNTHNYYVFAVYHQGLGGRGDDHIMFTRTTDQGQNWSTPVLTQTAGAGFPDITCGNNSILYLTYSYMPTGNNYNIHARRSLDLGASWAASQIVESDSFPKMGPQIAAAYDGSGNVWVIWPRQDLNTANDDWGLRWSWSQDSAATWSSPSWTNSDVDSNEVLPSIAVNDYNGSTSATPYVCYIKSYYDWTGDLSVRSFEWEGSSWSTDTCYSDSNAFLTRPIQTFTSAGTPAIAYVGENSEKVYFDSWANASGIAEDNDIVPLNGKIECSIDRSIITGAATLKYTLASETTVDISIVNILGQTVATLDSGSKEGGEHTIKVSAENLSQGIYYIVIGTNGGTGTAKFTVLK